MKSAYLSVRSSSPDSEALNRQSAYELDTDGLCLMVPLEPIHPLLFCNPMAPYFGHFNPATRTKIKG